MMKRLTSGKDANESNGRVGREQARVAMLPVTKAVAEFEATAYRHSGKTLTA
jgi:hypothetical protein